MSPAGGAVYPRWPGQRAGGCEEPDYAAGAQAGATSLHQQEEQAGQVRDSDPTYVFVKSQANCDPI